MTTDLFNPQTHVDWVKPHSFAWYAQLAKLTGKYEYSWNSTIVEPNGELIFADEVAQMVPGKRVLDIGCGHGEFTMQWSPVVEQIVGIDVTDDFVNRGNGAGGSNVTFQAVNTKNGLPFADGEFDCAYNRRGPTSAYLDLKRIVKKGGKLLALHPGDRMNLELDDWFPGLSETSVAGAPFLEVLTNKLVAGGLMNNAEIETISTTQYLHAPMDVLKITLFGQRPSVFDAVIQESMPEIERIFRQHAAEQGLPITFERYLVRATI